jgi:hypothetical protein
VRTGNDVYKVTDAVTKDGVSSIPLVDCLMYFQDGKRPSVIKQFMGVDVIGTGNPTITWQFINPDTGLVLETRLRIPGDHRAREHVPDRAPDLAHRAAHHAPEGRGLRDGRAHAALRQPDRLMATVRELTLPMALELAANLGARDRMEILRMYPDLDRWALERCTLPGNAWALIEDGQVIVAGGIVDQGTKGTLWLAGRTGWRRSVKHAVRIWRAIRESGLYRALRVPVRRGQPGRAALRRAHGLPARGRAQRPRRIRDGRMNWLLRLLFPAPLYFGGGGGGDGGAGQQQADEARKSALRSKIDAMYGIGPSGARPTPHQFQTMGSVGSSVEVADTSSTEAPAFDETRRPPPMRQRRWRAERNQVSDATRGYYTDQLTRAFGGAERNNRFALARQG